MAKSKTHCNSAPTGKNKLVEKALTKDGNIHIPILAASRDFIPDLIFALSLPSRYTDKNL